MKKIKQFLAVAAVLLVCVSAMTACTGNSTETTTGKPTTAPSGTAAAPDKKPSSTKPTTGKPEQEATTAPSSSADKK